MVDEGTRGFSNFQEINFLPFLFKSTERRKLIRPSLKQASKNNNNKREVENYLWGGYPDLKSIQWSQKCDSAKTRKNFVGVTHFVLVILLYGRILVQEKSGVIVHISL